MVGSAKTAMRHPRFARIPRAAPLRWVVEKQAAVSMGRRVRFERYGRTIPEPRAEVARPRPVPPPGGGSGEATGRSGGRCSRRTILTMFRVVGFFNA